MHKTALLIGLTLTSMQASDFPEAEISNKAITAKFYLPDAEKGYYRGTRFDWSGQIYSLKANGHEYFGQWFERYDPKLHDAIMGPVEEFNIEDAGPGYAEAKPGETFLRIGVGVLRKIDEKRFERFKTYEIVDPGKWSVKTGKDRIEFTHEVDGKNGYAYRYTKIVRLEGDSANMVIEHRLRNTGTKDLRASSYNHNFFVIDGQPTGPASSVKFPFNLQAKRNLQADMAEVRGKEIVYLKELQKGQSVYGEFEGFGSDASDYDVIVENRNARAGVRIKGDRPLSKIVYWSIRTTFCPEPYINIEAAAGKETTWRYVYQFYALK